MKECCGNGCIGCSDNEKNKIQGYINIYDIGGLYQAMSAIYDTEDRAIEVGKVVKGYVGTVFISLPKNKIGKE